MLQKLLLINNIFCKTKGSLWLPLVFISNILVAQINLVPNPSFENYTICPVITNAPSPWYIPTNFGPMYANKCSKDPLTGVPRNNAGQGSYQFPRSGNGYIILDYINGNYGDNIRFYSQVRINDSLNRNKLYYCEFYVNTPDGLKYGCNNVGMLFSKSSIYVDTVAHNFGLLYNIPQILNFKNPVIYDTLNWIKVSGIYKAKGGEQYLTLGNFSYDTQTIYKQFKVNGYSGAGSYIDDVSVTPLDSFCLKADAGKDTTITIGDSIFIGSYTNGLDSIKWLQNGAAIDSIRPGFWVKPTTGTSYILQQTVNGCFSSDTVTIGVLVPLKFVSFTAQIQPTPNPSKEGNVLLWWQTVNEINVSHFNIQRSVNGVAFTTIGKAVAQNKSINNYEFTDVHLPSLEGLGVGLYYRIQSIDKDGKISYSETRTISYNHFNHSISVFPNPAKYVVTINCVGMKEINIVNSLGQLIKRLKVYTDIQKIDISEFGKGLYLLKIINNKNIVYNEKFIVQ